MTVDPTFDRSSPDRAALRLFHAAAVEMHPDLTSFDLRSGDGDFGDNLRTGLDTVLTALDLHPNTDAYRVAADVFLDDVGGTSGPLLGLLFQSLARARSEEKPDWLSLGIHEGALAIQRVGEAQRGDRTLVDALLPAGDRLREGASAAEAASAAVQAAAQTASIRARMGRTSYVGDHALGVPDPGATGIALLLWAIASAEEPGILPAGVRSFLPNDLQNHG